MVPENQNQGNSPEKRNPLIRMRERGQLKFPPWTAFSFCGKKKNMFCANFPGKALDPALFTWLAGP